MAASAPSLGVGFVASSNSVGDVKGAITRPIVHEPNTHQARLEGLNDQTHNMFMLCMICTVYFGFRSGCCIVLPLVSKLLLQEQLEGASYSPLYQLPLAIWFAMDIIIATPNAVFMQKYGRRAGFMVGALVASIASFCCFLVLIFVDDRLWAFGLMVLMVACMAIIGMAEFARYAAAEVCVDDANRSKFVGRVVSGGAILSMFGPFMASLAANMGSGDIVHGFGFYFLFMSFFSLVAFAAASQLRLPTPPQADRSASPPLRTIVRRTDVWMSILAQVVVQFSMVTPMSATPLAMTNHLMLPSGSFLVSGCVVSHVLSMFVPGFFTGNIIEHLGILPVMGIGLCLQASCMLIMLQGEAAANFYCALILLGAGWNFAFVAGTMLLLRSHAQAERTKVTSCNETLRFAANGVAVVLSSSFTFDVISYICLGALVIAGGVVVLSLQREAKQRRDTPLA